MLTLTVKGKEFWNENTQQFQTIPSQEIQLEHSLISLSKWESKWHKPFLLDEKRSKQYEKTQEELIDYIRCMTITKKVDPIIFYMISHDKELMQKIYDYINDPMTATTFRDNPDSKKHVNSGNFTTAEIIYYQMVALNIPLEWEKRHLNKLLTLIRVVAEKQEQANNPKKMSHGDIAKQQRALHQARKKPHIPRR
ncbi:MAG: hypothetical protein J6U54_15895 [Clostridiales bacterium]|nr:hypothetical protein [Clostridiales bacterium]